MRTVELVVLKKWRADGEAKFPALIQVNVSHGNLIALRLLEGVPGPASRIVIVWQWLIRLV